MLLYRRDPRLRKGDRLTSSRRAASPQEKLVVVLGLLLVCSFEMLHCGECRGTKRGGRGGEEWAKLSEAKRMFLSWRRMDSWTRICYTPELYLCWRNDFHVTLLGGESEGGGSLNSVSTLNPFINCVSRERCKAAGFYEKSLVSPWSVVSRNVNWETLIRSSLRGDSCFTKTSTLRTLILPRRQLQQRTINIF